MNLKGSKTEKNLWEAFAGESQARNKYTYYASKAKKDGYVQISKFFEDTANNEKEHAKIWFKLLKGGQIPETEKNSLLPYIPKDLESKVHFIKNDCRNIWEWTEKVYHYLEKL